MGHDLLRRTLLVLVALTLVVAVFAGLARVGFDVGPVGMRASDHGPLMVLGVFGTVISLERAVALAKNWGYVGAWCGGLSALALVFGIPLARALVLGASVGLVLVSANIAVRGSAAFTWLMLLASLLFLGGNVAWVRGAPVQTVVPAWLAFFVLTIVAERLELSRLVRAPAWAERLLLVLTGLFSLLVAWQVFCDGPSLASRCAGALLALIAIWEFRFDLARRTVRTSGLPRYAAVAVLAGAGWLFIVGAGLACSGFTPFGPLYDATLHGVFIGFVLSVVFGHAPIILPAVARVRLPFHWTFYLPLGLLHVSLATRIAGDLAGSFQARRIGTLLNAISLLLFLLTALTSRMLAKRAS